MPANLTNDEIDEIVQFEYPYIVANIYKLLIESTNDEERIAFIFKTFNYSVRSIALMLVVRYLDDLTPEINNQKYNEEIKEFLPKPRIHQWISLMKNALEVYKDKRDYLMVTELYDLYWNPDPSRDESIWDNMNRIASLENDIIDGKTDRSSSVIADELMARLRQMMKDFIFMRDYEMWLVDKNDQDRQIISVRLHRGNNITPQNYHHRQIQNIEEIEEHYYYLTHRYSPTPARQLLKLDPLVVDPNHNNLSPAENSIGIYNSWVDDPDDNVPGRLEYLILAADARDRDMTSRETSRDALISKFLRLYENQLRSKEGAFKVGKTLTWGSLNEVFESHSRDQMSSVISKYDEHIYVDRQDFRMMIDNFLNAQPVAVVISGNAGVGKSNFLVSTYFRTWRNDQITSLWLDGAKLLIDNTLSQNIIDIVDQHLISPHSDSSMSSEMRLKHLLTQGIFARHNEPRMLVLIIDAINEHARPIEALQAVNTFINQFGNVHNIKVVLSSRPQVWRYAKSKNLHGFTSSLYYKDLHGLEDMPIQVEHDSLVLRNYTRDEQIQVFEKLINKFQLTNSNLLTLSRALRETLRDPLVMNIICETFKGDQIPAYYPTSALIEKLIDTLIEDERNTLHLEDVEFLEDNLIPQFLTQSDLPLNALSRTMLTTVRVGSRTLDDLVSDKTPYSDGETVNAQFQRLMNTGWVIKEGPSRNYFVRFRYEYFYDHFVGQYISNEAVKTADPADYFMQWALKIKDAPFLWGVLRNSLFTLTTEQNTDIINTFINKITQIDESGDNPQLITILKHLAIDVLTELHQTNPDRFNAYILTLIPNKIIRRTAPLSALIGLEVAYGVNNAQALANGLSTLNKELESSAVQFVFRLWKKALDLEGDAQNLRERVDGGEEVQALRKIQANELDTEASEIYKVALNTIRIHFDNITIRQPRRMLRSIEMAIATSFAIGFGEYAERGVLGRMDDILSLWQPTIQRFRFLFGSSKGQLSRVRRILMYPTAFLYVNVVRRGIQRELLMSIGDMSAFFPPNADKKRLMNSITDYIEVRDLAPEEIEPLMDMSRYILKTYDDLMTMYIAWGAMCTLLIGNPKHGADSVEKLYWEADFIDKQQTYVSPMVGLLTITWQNLSFQSEKLDRETQLDILDRYGAIISDFELRFNGRMKGKRNRYYWSELPEHLVWNYRIKQETTSSVSNAIYDHIFEHKSGAEQVESISFLIRRFAHIARCALWEAPEVALDNFGEIVRRLSQPEHQKLRRDVSNTLAEAIASVKAVVPDQVDDFIISMESADLDPQLRERIIRSRPSLNIGYVLSDGVILFFRTMIEDPDPTIREGFKELMRSSTHSDNIYDWVAHQLIFIIGHIRNSSLMTGTSQEP